MNVLVVAHPDDEVLFFNPETFDKIVVCYLHRGDDPGMKERRVAALAEHPLGGKIECLGLAEGTSVALAPLAAAQGWTAVTTHGAHGEYGHPHHKLVFRACMEQLNCPVNGMYPALYRSIKAVYQRHGCWTWDT